MVVFIFEVFFIFEESDTDYSDEKLLIDDDDDQQQNTRKRKQNSPIQSRKGKKQKSTLSNVLNCEICDVVFTRKDNLARHNRN